MLKKPGGWLLKVIAVCGMPGSGKEEFVAVAREEGFIVVRMGDIVRKEVKARGLALTNENVGRVANEEREKHGLGIWATRTLSELKGKIMVIDGIRGDSELEIFRKSLGNDLLLVGILASPKSRFERIRKRGRKDATMSWEEFLQRDERELGWGIGKALSLCKHRIENEGTLEEFREKARVFLKKHKA